MVEAGWDTSNLVALADSGGNGILCESCCDENVGEDCEYCTDTPLNYYVTISDVLICDGCYVTSGDSGNHYDDFITINGTHTLTQQTNPCVFKKTMGASGTFTQYDNTDCTGAVLGQLIQTQIVFTLTVSSGSFSLAVDNNLSPAYPMHTLFLGSGSKSGTNCTGSFPTISNSITSDACSSLTLPAAYRGGSATIAISE